MTHDKTYPALTTDGIFNYEQVLYFLEQARKGEREKVAQEIARNITPRLQAWFSKGVGEAAININDTRFYFIAKGDLK